MTATTAPIAHGDGHAHGGGHHHTSLGLDNRKIAIWTFIGSECMLFASLISTYLIYKGRSPQGPYPHEAWTNPSTGEVMKPILDIPVTSASTFVLLMSSVAMVMALNAVQTKYEPKITTWDKIKGSSKLWLGATALLGTIFLMFQAYEFTSFIHEGLTIEVFQSLQNPPEMLLAESKLLEKLRVCEVGRSSQRHALRRSLVTQ